MLTQASQCSWSGSVWLCCGTRQLVLLTGSHCSFIGRLPLLLGCRKYVLNNLYSDLRGLSTTAAPHGEDIELDDLPAPTTHTPKSGGADTALLHEGIARWIFSWTFSECCILFILLIMQGLDVFTPRCAGLPTISLHSLKLMTVLVCDSPIGSLPWPCLSS